MRQIWRLSAERPFVFTLLWIGFLLWGYAKNSSTPRMSWMGMPMEGVMPGMATREQIMQLEAAEGEVADVLFMQLMIPHHESGVKMARAAFMRSEIPVIRDFALKVMQSQEGEVDYMESWLRERGYDIGIDEE